MLPSNQGNAQADTASQEKGDFAVSAAAILLPKGGGTIRGIGEKFAANPVTGTASMTVPVFEGPALHTIRRMTRI